MSQGRKIANDTPLESIEAAMTANEYQDARYRTALKLARLLDGCDSARDAKSLARTLDELIDKCERDDQRKLRESPDTPLHAILAEAETVIRNA